MFPFSLSLSYFTCLFVFCRKKPTDFTKLFWFTFVFIASLTENSDAPTLNPVLLYFTTCIVTLRCAGFFSRLLFGVFFLGAAQVLFSLCVSRLHPSPFSFARPSSYICPRKKKRKKKLFFPKKGENRTFPLQWVRLCIIATRKISFCAVVTDLLTGQ